MVENKKINDEWYTQCLLSRKEKNEAGEIVGEHITIGWIPAWASKVNNRVELLDLSNKEELWDVVKTYGRKRKEDVLADERGFKEFQNSLHGGGIDEK